VYQKLHHDEAVPLQQFLNRTTGLSSISVDRIMDKFLAIASSTDFIGLLIRLFNIRPMRIAQVIQMSAA